MKKTTLFIITALLCCNAVCQEIGPYKFSIGTFSKFHKQSKRMAENNKLLNFGVRWESRMDGVTQFVQEYDVFIDYGKSPVVYINNISGMTKTILTKDYVKIVDDMNRNLIVYSRKAKNKDYYEVGIENCLSALHSLEYILYPLGKKFNPGIPNLLLSSSDTLLHGVEYVKYVGHSGRYYEYNDETGARDIPYDEIIYIFINKATDLIDSVFVTNITKNKYKYEAFYNVFSVSNDDIRPSFDSIFDFTQKAYAGYSLHDETNPPANMFYTQNKYFSDEVLDFPIVDLNGDTTTIREEKGFICLDLWFIGCGACMKELEMMKKEKDSLGYRIIENAGIKLFCVNEFSDNAALIRETTARYDCEDIIYFAKGFNTVYNATPCPYIILISPDKKKIFESSGLQNWDEVLKAKQNYETK
ncbi:MAG: hypothetical protein MJZ56_07785 [Bacteroidales bacterium]|nr:hypothetical protein [Bacteroidales bacterium]